MRLSVVLIILLALSFTACQSLPPPPVGDLCIIDTEAMEAVCVPISRVVQMERLDPASGTYTIPVSQMNNYVAESPETWAEISAYIQKLKVLAQTRCQ